MAGKRVIVTGAHSYLGQRVLAHLAGDHEITAVITPWTDDGGSIADDSINYVRADLTRPLDSELAAAVNRADRVLHFAWRRLKDENEAYAENLAMIENLQAHISQPAVLVFISSVAASPGTLSSYGRTKYRLAKKLIQDGAVVLVTGLIVDPEPKGPYKLLVDAVRKSPVSARITRGAVNVYPIRTADYLDAISTLLETDVSGGSYRLYPAKGCDLAEFLRLIEKKHKRARIPVFVPYGLSMAALKAARTLGILPSTLGEKLLTFLYKDDEYLSTHRTLPGTKGVDRPVEEMI